MALSLMAIVISASFTGAGTSHSISSQHQEEGRALVGCHGVILNGFETPKSDYDAELDGKVEEGCSFETLGCHAGPKMGQVDEVSVGVCLIGIPGSPVEGISSAPDHVVPAPWMTGKQFKSLMDWCLTTCETYGLDPIGTYIHPKTGQEHFVIDQLSAYATGEMAPAEIMDMVQFRQELENYRFGEGKSVAKPAKKKKS